MSRDPLAPPRATYLARALRSARSSPRDAVQKVAEKAARRWEQAVKRGRLPHNSADPDWERRLHELLGAPWPCPDADAFAAVWTRAKEAMAQHGLRVGRENYGGDDDADEGLARALWCSVCHIHAAQAVETGVAHGLSSRTMLEAMQRAQYGRLWSIDLPPMTIHDRRGEVAVAVSEELRGRWAYLEGSSRSRLPTLLSDVGQIDLFFHDSLHSTRNVHWELATAWPALTPGGIVIVDDVDCNWGFERFREAGPGRDPLWCMADDGQRVFAIVRKPGARRGQDPG
jgi:predicted O-methyltransferase YrrM